MERVAPSTNNTMDEAQNTMAEAVRAELELGITFLEVAAATADGQRAHRNVRNAITALRTADKFLRDVQPGNVNAGVLLKRRALLPHLEQRIGSVSSPSVIDQPTRRANASGSISRHEGSVNGGVRWRSVLSANSEPFLPNV